MGLGSNLSPRGLFLRPTPGSFAVVDGVWLDPDGLGFHDAEIVFAWNGTEWAVVWAAEAADVSSVTLTWATSQVTVSWVLPSPEIADSYNVYRPDGSLVTNVSAGSTSVIDSDPLPSL